MDLCTDGGAVVKEMAKLLLQRKGLHINFSFYSLTVSFRCTTSVTFTITSWYARIPIPRNKFSYSAMIHGSSPFCTRAVAVFSDSTGFLVHRCYHKVWCTATKGWPRLQQILIRRILSSIILEDLSEWCQWFSRVSGRGVNLQNHSHVSVACCLHLFVTSDSQNTTLFILH